MIYTMVDFSVWLTNELRKRDISPTELSRLSKKAPAVISRVINGERKPAPETIDAIAKALNLPTETVYRAAGLLPQANEIDEAVSRLNHTFLQLSKTDQEDAQAFVEYKLKKAKEEAERQRAAKRVKTGPLPGMGG